MQLPSRQHAPTQKVAGVDRLIHFQQRPVSELRHSKPFGFIVTNPPYGERIEAKIQSPCTVP